MYNERPIEWYISLMGLIEVDPVLLVFQNNNFGEIVEGITMLKNTVKKILLPYFHPPPHPEICSSWYCFFSGRVFKNYFGIYVKNRGWGAYFFARYLEYFVTIMIENKSYIHNLECFLGDESSDILLVCCIKIYFFKFCFSNFVCVK